MTVWVTGAVGFIGQHLVRAIVDTGETVHGIGHGALSDWQRKRIGLGHWLDGEIDANSLQSLFKLGGAPSAIYHLAGGASVGLSFDRPHEDFQRTVSSTARLLEWLRRSSIDCRLIVGSSAAVYGTGHSGSIVEKSILAPVSPYGWHKRMTEELCESYAAAFGIRGVIVRLFSVFGPGLRKQLLWDLCSRLQAGERTLALAGTGAETRDWCGVGDVARLLAMFRNWPDESAFEVINGGSGVGTTVRDVARMVVEAWGASVEIGFSGVVSRGDPFSLVADASRLSDVGFTWNTALGGGVEEYVKWFRERDN